MVIYFSFIPLLLPLLIIFLSFRVLPKLFRDIQREMGEKTQYRNRLLSPNRRRQFGSRKLSWLEPKDIEAVIFNLAYQLKGKITLSDVIIESGLSMKEAEAVLDGMVDGVRVVIEVDNNGLVMYEFPEIIARFKNEGGR